MVQGRLVHNYFDDGEGRLTSAMECHSLAFPTPSIASSRALNGSDARSMLMYLQR